MSLPESISAEMAWFKLCHRRIQMNGVTERYNRTLLQKLRSLLLESEVIPNFRGKAVLHSSHLINFTQTGLMVARHRSNCNPA